LNVDNKSQILTKAIEGIYNLVTKTDGNLSTRRKTMKVLKLPSSIEVDSLKLRIPLNQLDEVNIDFIKNPHLEVSEVTGEVTRIKNKGYRIPIGETAVIHVDIKHVKAVHNKPPIECLIILLNAKQLGARYFEGITKDNLQIIYNNLIGSGLFKFSWKTFLQSSCTDIDLKFDEVMNRDSRIELVKSFNASVLPKRTDSVKAYTKPSAKNNNSVGIQFNHRERATKSKPFFKIYSKGSESIAKDTQSVDKGETPFFDAHFSYKQLEDICRIETTIKDKSMASAIGLKSLELGQIVHWNEETKVQVFRYMFSKYLSTHVLKNEAKPKDSKITPSDMVHFNAMVMLIKHTETPIESIIDVLVRNIDSKVSKSRMKTKLEELYREHIENTNHDVEDAIKKVGQFLNKFGIA